MENENKIVKHSLPILFVSSEATPFAPDGDLAVKVHDLATKIASLEENHYVAVVIPGYQSTLEKYRDSLHYLYSFKIGEPYQNVGVRVYQTFSEGVNYFILDIPAFFSRERMYNYPDDAYRFTAFSLAVLHFVKDQEQMKVRYDIVHSFDWETGFIPYLLRTNYPWMRAVYTVNEPDYQCSLESGKLWDLTHFSFSLYTSGVAKQNDRLNILKTGLTLADVVTVSNKEKADILKNDLASYENLGYIFNFKGRRFIENASIESAEDYDEIYNRLADEALTRYTWEKED